MSKKSLPSPLEDLGKITIGDLLSMLKSLSMKAIVSLVGIIVAYTSIIFGIGSYVVMKSSGIALSHPFDMRISVRENDMDRNESGRINYKLTGLILSEPPWDNVTQKHKKCYVVFRDFGDLKIEKIGQIECLVEKSSILDIVKKGISIISPTGLVNTAFAQNFSLGVHQNDNNYTQSFVDQNTIRRTYSDGCVLQFKIDANGVAIIESFVWIVNRH
jgi:hypothetical protein